MCPSDGDQSAEQHQQQPDGAAGCQSGCPPIQRRLMVTHRHGAGLSLLSPRFVKPYFPTSVSQLVVRMCWLPVSCVLCLDKHKDNTTYNKIKWDRLFVAGSPANDASLTRYHTHSSVCFYLSYECIFLIQMRTKCQNPWEAQTFLNRTVVPVVLPLICSEDHPIARREARQVMTSHVYYCSFINPHAVTFCHQWMWLSL